MRLGRLLTRFRFFAAIFRVRFRGKRRINFDGSGCAPRAGGGNEEHRRRTQGFLRFAQRLFLLLGAWRMLESHQIIEWRHEAQRERLKTLHADISQLEQAISRSLYEDIQIIKRLRATLLAQSQASRDGRDANVVELRDIRQTLGRVRSNQQWSAGILATRERLEAELHPRSLTPQQPRPGREELEQVLYRVVKRHLVV